MEPSEVSMKGVLSLDHMVWGLGWRCVARTDLGDTRILLALCFYRQCSIIDYYVLFSAYLGKMSTQPHFMHKCSTLFMFTVCVKMHKIATCTTNVCGRAKSYADLCSDITTWQSLLFQIYFNLRVMYWYFVSLVNSMVF